MPFEWSWNGLLNKAGEQGMEGYTPNGPSQTASAQMQNYNPNSAPMRLPQSVNNPGQGASYNFDATEINQYIRQEDEKKQRIASLEAQISNLEKSIMEKQAQLKNWSGVDNEIAAIEASKINTSDPTMVWRWNRGRQDTKEANDKLKIDDLKKFKNTTDMLVGQRIPVLAASQEQMLRNVESAIRDGNNVGAYDDVKRLIKRKAELEERLYGKKGLDTGLYQSGDRQADITHYIDSLKIKNPSVEEIDSVLQYRDEMTPDQISKLETMRSEAVSRARSKKKSEDRKARRNRLLNGK
jgi:hypothetical protein